MRRTAALLCILLLAGPSLAAAQPTTYRGRSISQWSDDLSHPNSVVRIEAGKMLGRLGNNASQAIDPLIAALRDRHPDVRLYAATALGRIHHQPEKCLTALIKLLDDRDEHVRFAAEWSLARIAQDVAKGTYTTEMTEKFDSLLAVAETSLAGSARNHAHVQQIAQARQTLQQSAVRPVATPPVEPSPKSPTPAEPPAATPQTGQSPGESLPSSPQPGESKPTMPPTDPAQFDRSPAHTSDVAALLADLRAEDKVTQLKAVAALTQQGRATELIDAWQAAGEFGFLHWHLMQGVIQIGEPAVPALTRTLRGEDTFLAMDAAECLGQMRPTPRSAIEPLRAVASDRGVADDVRTAAIRAIGNLDPAAFRRDTAIIDATADNVTENVVSTLIGILTGDDEAELKEASIRTLAAIGQAARAAGSLLLETLRDIDQPETTRIAAAEAFAAISPATSENVTTLATLLSDDAYPDLVAAVAGALGGYGDAAAEAVPRLCELIDETTEFDRRTVIQTLGKIGPAARPATVRLIECLTEVEEFEGVQVAAAKALAQIGPASVKQLTGKLDHSSHQVRVTIMRGLIEMGARAEPAVKPLELRLLDDDEDEQIQALAAVALGQIGPAAESAIPTLVRLFGDVRQAVYLRAMAAISIGQIDREHSPVLVAGLHDPDARIRVASAYALQRMPAPHPDALPMLLRELEDDAARGAAMQALSEFPEASLTALTEVARDHSKDEATRIACLTLISERGASATGQLLEALNDDTLAESAYWCLRDLGNDSIPHLIAAVDDEQKFGDDARAAIHDLVEELFEGIGGGDGDVYWSGGHALVEGAHGGSRSGVGSLGMSRIGAGMETAAPQMMERDPPPTEFEPENASAQEVAALPEPDSADIAPMERELITPPTVSNDEYQSVKVFYGTNRQRLGDDVRRDARLPWFAWLFIAATMGGMVLYVVRQFRRGATSRGVVGVAVIILFAVAVDTVVARIQRLDQELSKTGPTYGPEYSTQVSLGTCEVTIPKIHQTGQIERPSVFHLQFVEDPERHIILKTVREVDSDAFYADLQSELGRKGNSILVFVHGYNVSFESAARRTAQMSHDLKFSGAPIFFSWPSQASWRKYRVDEKNVELSVNQLKQFLLEISARSGADTINLIAHSMGNRALTKSLKEIELASAHENRLFNQVILAAPDIDADEFRERIAPAIIPKARHITLYASSQDLALAASREFNSGDPRAGDAGEDLVVIPGIDTIDVSAGESSLLGHSYYGDSRSVLHDIQSLLRDQPAAERRFLEPVPQFEPTHWLFRPASVAQRDDATERLR